MKPLQANNLSQNTLYTIKSALDNTFVLDCSQSNDPAKKFSACLWKNTGDFNQKFQIIRRDNNSDFYIIKNQGTNRVMQIKDSKINNGAKVVFQQARNQPCEWWQLVPVGKVNPEYGNKTAFFFRSFCGKTIDIKHAKAVADAEVFQYDYNGNANQIWIFQ